MDVASAPAGEQVAAGTGAPTPAGDSAASETAAPQAITHPSGKAPPAGLLSAEKKGADQPSLGATQAPIRAAAPRQIEAAAGKAPAPTGEKPDESVSCLLATGEKALEATRYAEAGQVFTKALNLLLPGHPDRPRALLGLARAQEEQGNLAGALRTYGELAKESPAHRELAEGKIRELSGPEVK
jgi:tetratricopeptide (TPR) repeat protein